MRRRRGRSPSAGTGKDRGHAGPQGPAPADTTPGCAASAGEPEARIWIDGSCDTRKKASGWGAVVLLPDGTLRRAGGECGAGLSSTDIEIEAAMNALCMVGEDVPVRILTDCRALADAIEGRIDGIALAGWDNLRRRIVGRTAPVKGRWARRNSSRHMTAAHHLANAARLVGDVVGTHEG